MIRIYKKNNTNGFTLPEVLISIAIIGIIIGIVGSVVMNFSFISNFIYVRTGSQTQTQDVFSRFLEELRKSTASSNGAYAIESASTSSLVFYSDVLGDSNTERLRYYLNGTSLNRGITLASAPPVVYATSSEKISTLVRNLSVASSGVFSYYGPGTDVSGTPLPFPIDISQIRIIKINLSIVETVNGVSSTRTFSASVAPRSILLQ